PLPSSAPVRPARRMTDNGPFTPATYVHLPLACGALLPPGVGEQILISALVDQIRADAAEQSITVTDSISDPRQLVRPLRLVENPALFRAELPDDELDVLSRERHELARQLDENFGVVLEVRAEGVLAYDPSGTLTDLDFPGAGRAKQAALLLLDELATALAPSGESLVM